MLLYLSVPAPFSREALRYTARLAHMAYRVNASGRLARTNPLQARGGLMFLTDTPESAYTDVPALCREIWRECASRCYAGAVAALTPPLSEEKRSFLLSLSALLTRNNRRLYVPEAYGADLPQAQVLICTALSGGVLRERLEEAQERFGPRLALDLQRLRMRFPLPCESGEGEALSGEALSGLLAKEAPAVYYSADLGAKYFTLHREGGCAFVLFDDADTLRRKVELGRTLGVRAGFFTFSEVRDLLPRLYGQRG